MTDQRFCRYRRDQDNPGSARNPSASAGEPMASVPAIPATFPLTPHLTKNTNCVARQGTPPEVLDALNVLAKKCLPPLSVLGAARFPIKSSDWRSTRIGRDAFLHSSAPQGWWDEYAAMAKLRMIQG